VVPEGHVVPSLTKHWEPLQVVSGGTCALVEDVGGCHLLIEEAQAACRHVRQRLRQPLLRTTALSHMPYSSLLFPVI